MRALAWLTILLLAQLTGAPAAASRGLDVNEIVGIATFTDLNAASGKISLSPDGSFLVAVVERATADRKLLQADVLLWRTADLDHPRQVPAPIRLARFTGENGPLVQAVKWAGDGRSLMALVAVDLKHSSLWQLKPEADAQRVSLPGQNVRSFDTAGPTVIYTATAASPSFSVGTADGSAPGQVGTASPLEDLLFPGEGSRPSNRVDLWRWTGAEPAKVSISGPLRPSNERNPLALSPDGRLAVVDFPVADVPAAWSEFASDTRLNVTAAWKSGPQPFTDDNVGIPHQFALLDLATGLATPIADGPDAQSRGILLPSPSLATWSVDSTRVVISATFLPGHSTPCVAVVTLPRRSVSCVTAVAQSLDRVTDVKFTGPEQQTVQVDLQRSGEDRFVQRFEVNAAASTWKLASQRPWTNEAESRFAIRQDLNTPPLLVDQRQGATRVLYDPNQQLLRAHLAKWQRLSVPVPNAKAFETGLLVPDGPPPPSGYPLVIQTHGFDPAIFSASGIYEAPFAAQAFVKAGFAVVQLPMDCPVADAEEVPCHLAHYHAIINLLAARKVTNPDKVAIIGFSRTAIHVLAALTDPTFKFSAAVLQSGYLNTLSQYFATVNYFDGLVNDWMVKMIGSKPYGPGLARWQAVAPSFRYDRLTAPLRVEAAGRLDTMMMWEPFAAMRDQGRPADLLVMPSATHPLSNPAERAASQQGAVDWFSYWLQGRADRSPAKRAQYQRWDAMRARIAK